MLLTRAEFHRFMRRATDCGQRDLHIIIERLEHMATQEDIDRLSQQITDASTEVQTAVDGIRQDIADLKNANPQVDTTALEASVAQLGQAVSGLTDLDAENPAPQPPAENV